MEIFERASEWLSVSFSDLQVKCSYRNLADRNFYDSFYRHLLQRYSDHESLPVQYRILKEQTACVLADLLDSTDKIYSFGAGIGYVERVLSRAYGFRNISLWDEAPVAVHFRLPSDITVLHLDPLREKSDACFDAILMIQVAYALPTADLISIFMDCRRALEPQGKLLVLHYSARFSENSACAAGGSVMAKSVRDLVARFRFSMRTRPRQSLRALLYGGVQGWGWARDNRTYERLLRDAGFNHIEKTCGAGQAVLVASQCGTPLRSDPSVV